MGVFERYLDMGFDFRHDSYMKMTTKLNELKMYVSSTVPMQSVRQSQVTGPQVETKGHGGHGSLVTTGIDEPGRAKSI